MHFVVAMGRDLSVGTLVNERIKRRLHCFTFNLGSKKKIHLLNDLTEFRGTIGLIESFRVHLTRPIIGKPSAIVLQ